MADVEKDDLKKLEDLFRDENFKPTTRELVDLVNSAEIDEETRAHLKNILFGDVPQVFSGYGSYLAIALIVIMLLIIFFFGYKLYKSIRDKQKKREEKKKLKELKKKK